MNTAPVTRAEMLDWLQASCHRQGVPVTVHDPGVIAQVAALFGQTPRPAERRRAMRLSSPPRRSTTIDVPQTASGNTDIDDSATPNIVQDGRLTMPSRLLPQAA